MKKNVPVTDHEIAVPPGVNLVSKTDLKGRITYANDAFIEICGYSREELIGKAHNIVRHPDVPPAVFESMWEHIKKGHPWKGIVKNRAKSGDAYWVRATIVPIRKEDQIIGYMSVRTQASAADIEEATAAYAALKRPGRQARLPRLGSYLTIRSGFIAGSLFVAFLLLAGAGLGIGGLRQSNAEIAKIRSGTLEASRDIASVQQRIQDIRATLLEPAPRADDQRAQAVAIRQARADADAAIDRIGSNEWLKATDAASFRTVQESYARLMTSRVIPAEYMLEHDQAAQAVDHARLRSRPEYEAALHALRDLDARQAVGAKKSMAETEASNLARERIAIVGLLFGMLVVTAAGFVFQRRIVKPLDEAIKSLDRMAQGDLSGDINIYQIGETGQLLRANAVMQLHLNVILDEIRMVAKNIYDYVNGLNCSLYELNGVAEEQHDGLYRARDALDHVAQDADTTCTRIETVIAHLDSLEGRLGGADDLGLAMLKDFTRQVSGALRFQNLSAGEAAERIQRVASLVVDCRQGTQSAYSASQALQKQADELVSLVSYFETSAEARQG